MYLDYSTYKSLGGTLTDEATFNRLEYQAAMDVDHITADRLKDDEVDLKSLEALKMLMLELVEDGIKAHAEDTLSQKYGKSIASMSNDGVSVSFDNSSNQSTVYAMKQAHSRRYAMIQKYLPEYSYRGLI